MTSRTIRLLVLALAITLCWSSASLAVSEAAMLFLQIAPGARASGLGEAYVAIADDATATHWNPAGLGKHPLAADWLDKDIPAHLRPITSFAAVKKGSGGNYLGYEIWAITADGLKRYDYRDWNSSEVFSVPSNQTLKQFVTRYFRIDDEEEQAALAKRVAVANNDQSYEWLGDLKDSLLALVPEDYSAHQSLSDGLDSLMLGYFTCRLDWGYISAMQEHMEEGYEDGSFSERELDRINVAVERAYMRFIKEEISIPFTALFSSAPTALESNGDVLLVGSADGLFRYAKSSWRKLSIEDGLPSENITNLRSYFGFVLIGTDKGVVAYTGSLIKPLPAESELPEGKVSALGASSLTDIYAVVDHDLYHYDGKTWANWHEYTVVLDDDLDRVSRKFSPYGTQAEREQYLAKLDGLNQAREVIVASALDSTIAALTKPADPEPESETTSETASDTTTTVADDADTSLAEVQDAQAEEEVIADSESIGNDLQPGSVIKVPYIASIRGEVTDISVASKGRVWIGTEFGVMLIGPSSSSLVGWKRMTVDSAQNLREMIAVRSGKDMFFASADSATQQQYVDDLKLLNDLSDETLVVGQELNVYAYPTAYPIISIEKSGDQLYFATDRGLLIHAGDPNAQEMSFDPEKGIVDYSGGGWSRAGFKSMGTSDIDDMYVFEDEFWVLSNDRLVAKGKGKTEFTFMHAKWLPSLADDLFYEYLGFVSSHESIGTFGGNVTFLNYGDIVRTDADNNQLGTFQAFEVALTLSYGSSLSRSLKGGVSVKVIHSHLSDVGAGQEKGNGLTTAVALDLGLIYQAHPRLDFGLAITNLGPDVQYSDNAQQDPLPRNAAAGLAWKMLQGEYLNMLATVEANKQLVAMGDPRAQEFKEIIWSGGVEANYMDMIALRVGYFYDEVGSRKFFTLGFGVSPARMLNFDFAYIPADKKDTPLANTLRMSLTVRP